MHRCARYLAHDLSGSSQHDFYFLCLDFALIIFFLRCFGILVFRDSRFSSLMTFLCSYAERHQ